jgi:L-seryl-tRNA(Ser) seleniumtransferase
MLALTADAIGVRANALVDALTAHGWQASVTDGWSTIGGGSAPGATLATRLVQLQRGDLTADTIERRLRCGDPPVIARIQDDRVVLDLRTVSPAEDGLIVRALANHNC